MVNVSKFVRDHIPLCVCTLGLAVLGCLGYNAVRWIINKCHKTEKINQVAQNIIGPASPQRAVAQKTIGFASSQRAPVTNLNALPKAWLEMIVDHLEGSDLRSLKLTCKSMSGPISKSQRKRILSTQLALPAISCYGLCRAPGKEIEALYESDLEDTKKIVAQLKAEGRLSEINSAYYSHSTPLQSAVSGDLEKVKVLVEEGGAKDYLLGSNGEPEDCLSALGRAARSGNVEVVRYLLSQGAQVEVSLRSGYGDTVFVIPTLIDSYCDERWIQEVSNEEINNIFENQCKCLALILSYAKDLTAIRTQTSFGQCLVEVACIHGRRDLMELLLNFGFQWPALAKEDTRRNLFVNAVAEGHLEIVRWFVNTYKMDVNFHGNGGVTLLHMAKAARKEEVVNYLLSCGANPDALTNEGQDYQTYAKLQISLRAAKALAHYFSTMAGFQEFESFQECFPCLMDHDINSVIDAEGNTLLHLATEWPRHEYFYEEIIPALISKGADLKARNTKGQTPYDFGIGKINETYRRYATEQELREMLDRVKKLAI